MKIKDNIYKTTDILLQFITINTYSLIFLLAYMSWLLSHCHCKLPHVWLTNSMDQSPSWDDDSHSAGINLRIILKLILMIIEFGVWDWIKLAQLGFSGGLLWVW